MTLTTLQTFLGICVLLNWGVLLLWAGLFIGAHDWLFRLHGRWFSTTVSDFDRLHYAGMMGYKLAIILFCLVPYLALMWLA